MALHAFTITIVSRGTSYPPTLMSSTVNLGTRSGAAGYSRNVSDTTMRSRMGKIPRNNAARLHPWLLQQLSLSFQNSFQIFSGMIFPVTILTMLLNSREHAVDFLFADVEKVGETFRGDDFEGADLAEVAPVVTVRDDDGTAGTESEVEYWAVCFGESVEETVDRRFDEAMVANNGERVRRRGREVETLRLGGEFVSNEKESQREYHISI
ncbi:hypothetical protein HID58_000151 [Brassica napus]|uniref:Uncharacterized protein n=1 Tax=Brassica napus TaxID=3708 RepID=A0ABQ8EFQ8_BRANA|nr:hypothetical protein HID58_000151 [Brassica napus]